MSEKVAKEFGSDEARAEYLRKHPNADPASHTVKGKDPDEGYKPYGEEWSKKRNEKIDRERAKEDRALSKERERADKQPAKDKARNEKLEREKERRHRQLDKEDAARAKEKAKREKTASPADEFKDALLKHANQTAAVEFQSAVTSERVAIRFAKTFPSTEALNKYLQKHPKADARDHKVVRPEDKSDEDKQMDDLKSRARHNKRQEKKKQDAEAKAKADKDKESEDREKKFMDNLKSLARHNKRQEKKKDKGFDSPDVVKGIKKQKDKPADKDYEGKPGDKGFDSPEVIKAIRDQEKSK